MGSPPGLPSRAEDPLERREEQRDSNNDGQIDISDALHLLFYLFGGPPPPPPGPPSSSCGADPDAPGSGRDLGCGAYPPCGA